MFRTDFLSIIRSLNTVFVAIGICHASYVDSLLERSGWSSLADSQHKVVVGFYYKTTTYLIHVLPLLNCRSWTQLIFKHCIYECASVFVQCYRARCVIKLLIL